jgi:hypothetical protein
MKSSIEQREYVQECLIRGLRECTNCKMQIAFKLDEESKRRKFLDGVGRTWIGTICPDCWKVVCKEKPSYNSKTRKKNSADYGF